MLQSSLSKSTAIGYLATQINLSVISLIGYIWPTSDYSLFSNPREYLNIPICVSPMKESALKNNTELLKKYLPRVVLELMKPYRSFRFGFTYWNAFVIEFDH